MMLRRILILALMLCLIALPASAARYDLEDGRFIVVALGGVYGYARAADGTIYTWGDNQFGQLGRGYTSQEFSVNLPSVLKSRNTEMDLSRVKDIIATSNYNLLWMEDDTLYGAGSNGFLSLGPNEGTFAAHQRLPELPEKPAAIETGFGQVLMLTENGQVYAWGRNTKGEVGNGGTRNVGEPYRLPLENIVQICCGGHFSLALDGDGTLWGWGNNEYHVLSAGPESFFTAPIRIDTGDIRIASMAAGGYTVSLLDEDGAVWTWGRNDLCQLGYETAKEYSTTPRKVDLPLPAVSLASYNAMTYAILEDTSLWSWGNNSMGQLGQGLQGARMGLPGKCVDRGVVLVASGSLFAVCVLEDGTVLCAGANDHYELGLIESVKQTKMIPNGLDLIPD